MKIRFLLSACLLAALTLTADAAPKIKHVIVVAMENKDAFQANLFSDSYVYGNLKQAPYINTVLMPESAWASNFADELPEEDSEPHYVLMEAGAIEFDDASFHCDSDPLQRCSETKPNNWTASTAHLTAQIETAGLSWMTYQEDIDARHTGACAIRSSGLYAAKHNPFVFFADVAGNPPSAGNTNCIAHTKELKALAGDIAANRLANYVFVSPNICNDMHGGAQCSGNTVRTGDDFLKSFLPPLIAWANANGGAVLVVWDESKRTPLLPFVVAGTGVRKGYESKTAYSHRSIIKTVERAFSLPVLDAVKNVSDLSDLFEPGALP